MTQTAPETGTESDGPQTADAPTVLLRNEDDREHALDVCIADNEAVLTEDCHTVAGDSQCAIVTETEGELLKVDLRADNGGAVSLTVTSRSEQVPEFVVRRETIVVAGLD